MKRTWLGAIPLLVAASAGFAQQPAASTPRPARGPQCVVFPPPPSPKPPIGIPADAKYFKDRWFRVYEDKVSWKVAKTKCERLGGRLAVIPDEPTATFIRLLAWRSHLWLGAFEKEEGKWQWVDGAPVGFTDWMKGQPDDPTTLDVLVTGELTGWMDNLATDRGVIGFICEWKGK